MTILKWGGVGYECSTKGDKRFSAMCATMPDGRTIEMWYQCDVKGYQPGGKDWRLGKGKPPLIGFTKEQLFTLYVSIWRLWAVRNGVLVQELAQIAREKHAGYLTDMFAKTNPVNQANALVHIINDWGL